MLIKSGAKLVSSCKDVLEELKLDQIAQNQEEKFTGELSQEEKNVLDALSHEEMHVDIIIKLTKLETSAVSSTLSLLEIKGLIKNIGGQNYIKL